MSVKVNYAIGIFGVALGIIYAAGRYLAHHSQPTAPNYARQNAERVHQAKPIWEAL